MKLISTERAGPKSITKGEIDEKNICCIGAFDFSGSTRGENIDF